MTKGNRSMKEADIQMIALIMICEGSEGEAVRKFDYERGQLEDTMG